MLKSGPAPHPSICQPITMMKKIVVNLKKTLHTVSVRCYSVPMDENEMEYMDNLALDIYMEEQKYSDPAPDTRLWREMPTLDDWLGA